MEKKVKPVTPVTPKIQTQIKIAEQAAPVKVEDENISSTIVKSDCLLDRVKAANDLATKLTDLGYVVSASLPLESIEEKTSFVIGHKKKAVLKPRILNKYEFERNKKRSDFPNALLYQAVKSNISQLLHFDYGIFDNNGKLIYSIAYFELLP